VATRVSIETEVLEALRADPRLPHPEEIAVAVDGDAVRDARDVEGVRYVCDELSVRLLDAAQRSDAELRGMALQAIAWDAEAPAQLVDVKVTDGWVTLRALVSRQFESDAAYEDVAKSVRRDWHHQRDPGDQPLTRARPRASPSKRAGSMPGGLFTRDNLIAVSFPEEASAFEALARLKELDSRGAVGVRGAAA
jgi:BON domain